MGHTPKSFYRPELDALRFFAFLLVFLHHVLPHNASFYQRFTPDLVAEYLSFAVMSCRRGVDLFFILSAYLITSLMMREQEKTGTVKILQFYLRRILRIWPLYIAFCLFCALGWAYMPWEKLTTAHSLGLATFTENFAMVKDGAPWNPVLVLWSISVEEQFYLVWPILFAFLGAQGIPRMAIIAVIAAMVYRLRFVGAGGDEARLWFSTLSHVDSIVMGGALAVVGVLKNPNKFLIYSGIALSAVLFISAEINAIATSSIGYLAAIICWVLVLQAMAWVKVGESFLAKALVYLGKISFGLYVFHMAVLWIVQSIYPHLWAEIAITPILTVLCAAISYHMLELPFLRFKSYFTVIGSRTIEARSSGVTGVKMVVETGGHTSPLRRG